METVIFGLILAFSIAFLINFYKMNAADKKEEANEKEDVEVTALLRGRQDPYTYLITKGFYVCTDETGAKILKNDEHKPVFEIVFDQIIYDEERNCFICSLPDRKGIWLYYIADKQSVFKDYTYISFPSKYMHYRTYGYNNRTGILNKDYTELTKTKYTSVRMYDENHFVAEEPKTGVVAQLLIDLKGAEILTDIAFIYTKFSTGDTILVKDLQDQYFFFNLSDHSIIELPYKWVLKCGTPTGKELENNGAANLLRAMKETDEVFEGYDLKRLKGTILNQEGKALFPPKYDSIEFVAQENLVHFKVGFGEEQLWDYLSEEDFEHFDGSGFEPMLYGIIDANDQIIIPIEYTRISLLKEQFYKVNKGARLSFEVDYGGYAYNEPYWCWSPEGGKYGLYDLSGNLLLPVEYEDIYAVPPGSKGDIALVKKDRIQFMNIKGDRLVPA